MASIKSQGTRLRVSTTTAAAKVITAISKASPAVVTSAAHGLANGDIVVITGVVGMTEVNDRAFVVANQAANTFELKGVDSTNYTTYASGGSATPQTMTQVGGVTSFNGLGSGEATEIDTTDLASPAKEYDTGLQDFGTAQVALKTITDTGQTRMRALKASASAAAFSLTLSDGSVAAFRAFVRSFSLDVGGPDNIVTGQASLRVTGAPSGDFV